ncbi:DNA mismatch repair endonuclease MutL [Chamaesiphon minutus]|uniref:DNA mismatch repair protein MutL n=1 Tax=Chamaesiphon minutus (strain ATCC 27169 / PCC 6605) TaxID=1173020 RepID=K9U8H9_CHAP6|nr:DNA mismatch repair endonuclease MutL [Chamaesiphon minutus]AFY91372.1 DNA mismatch repair enzyme (predicted ATPase) [Chamaesiphon minutus PCC 6605]
MPIHTLPIEVIHLIAAGEVIDSLGAVVRELCENAIDAGATRITVSLFPDRWRIRVADNGSGIELADLQQAATAHSTSKIDDRDDLFHITSLGFRGEALHSLAQLANLEIYSRPRHSCDGWHLVYNHQGEVVRQQEVAIAPGTAIDVADLFGDWEARREGLPNLNCQLRQVQTVIYHLALCHPHVNWTIEQQHRPWFQIIGAKTTQQIIPQILPKVRVDDLHHVEITARPLNQLQERLELELQQAQATSQTYRAIAAPKLSAAPEAESKIQLTLGLPDRCHRHRLDWVKVAVNGRIVRAPELEQTIVSGLARTLPRDRYPVCFLHLQIPPHYIDWNRHPAKVEIYLQQVEYWQAQVAQALDRALNLQAETDDDDRSSRIGKLLAVAEQQGAYHIPQRSITNTNDGDGLGLLELRAVGQVLNTYIIAEHADGLWLVEQHIAHERVLYEQIVSAWQLLPLEPPIILSHLSERQIEQLQQIEITIDPFGEGLWAIRTAPAPLLMREDLAAAITELSQGGDLQAAQVAVACRCAIRNGTSLSLPEMQSLLDRWQRTRNPRTCPHGRPIYLAFKESSLARSFRRHWVIGKSHGI